MLIKLNLTQYEMQVSILSFVEIRSIEISCEISCQLSVLFQGSNHTFSADGHDKLMDFAKDTFPLAVYGMQDVFSGFLLYLKLWTSNSDPKLTARWYLEHLYESKGKHKQENSLLLS